MEKKALSGSTTRRGRPRAETATRRSVERPAEGPLEWIRSFGIAILLFLVIRTFLIQAYTIPSGSMEDTLLVGDYLMANNAIYGAHIPLTDLRVPAFREPKNGDVVVFRPLYNQPVIDVVKRVVAQPGDTIQMVDRVLVRNGQILDEPYVEPNYLPDEPLQRFGMGGYDWHLAALPAGTDAASYAPTRDTWGPLVLPEENYFLLGDNRDQSLDSRYMGFISRDVIRGKAMFIYFSYDRYSSRSAPRFITAARWNRIGRIIN
jgi:signal peptidase I